MYIVLKLTEIHLFHYDTALYIDKVIVSTTVSVYPKCTIRSKSGSFSLQLVVSSLSASNV